MASFLWLARSVCLRKYERGAGYLADSGADTPAHILGGLADCHPPLHDPLLAMTGWQSQ